MGEDDESEDEETDKTNDMQISPAHPGQVSPQHWAKKHIEYKDSSVEANLIPRLLQTQWRNTRKR